MTDLDRRLHAFRPDLADIRLRGRVEAGRWAEGVEAAVAASVADLHAAPDGTSGLDTQLLMGDAVLVFERRAGWAWVQAERDGYVGYVEEGVLSEPGPAATHVVTVPRTFLYAVPDMKRSRTGALSLGARVAVAGHAETRGTSYAVLASGEAVVAAHLLDAGTLASDYVAVAETLVLTPYLWGGASAFGLDCSGLVQLSMRMAGRTVLRDTDMQAGSVGEVLDPGPDLAGLRRGDLVFWKGHVGIMLDAENLIHANGHTMMVSKEPLSGAAERIAYIYGPPTGFRRP